MAQPAMTRLTFPLVIVSLILLVIAGVSAWFIHRSQNEVSDAVANHVASIRASQELELSIRDTRTQLYRYLAGGDLKTLDAVPRLNQRIADAVKAAERTANTEEEQALVKRVRKGYEDFNTSYDTAIDEQGEKDPKTRGVYAKLSEIIDTIIDPELLQPAHELLRLNEGILARASEQNELLARRLTLVLLGMGAFWALGGLLAGWAIPSSERRSMRQTEKRLRDAATRLDKAIPQPSTDSSVADNALDQMSKSVTAVLKKLEQTEQQALRAEQLAWVGQMAAGIAHEVRNPLMSIKLLVQAAADRAESQNFKTRDLQVLDEEIGRLELIVSGFLDFARPPMPVKNPMNLTELLRSAIEGVQARADLQGVMIEFVGPTKPLVVPADANQIRQVVYNLMYNALDAQPGGGLIRISVNRDDSLGTPSRVMIRFEDAGPGLPQQLGDSIFEPFVSTKESGLGLGLSICRRIIETHDGTLVQEKVPGLGAIFVIQLPTVDASATHPALAMA